MCTLMIGWVSCASSGWPLDTPKRTRRAAGAWDRFELRIVNSGGSEVRSMCRNSCVTLDIVGKALKRPHSVTQLTDFTFFFDKLRLQISALGIRRCRSFSAIFEQPVLERKVRHQFLHVAHLAAQLLHLHRCWPGVQCHLSAASCRLPGTPSTSCSTGSLRSPGAGTVRRSILRHAASPERCEFSSSAEGCLRVRRRISLTVRSAASLASIGSRLIVFLLIGNDEPQILRCATASIGPTGADAGQA